MPYINIYSGPIAKRETDPLMKDINALYELPGGKEMFQKVVNSANGWWSCLKKTAYMRVLRTTVNFEFA